MLNIFKPFMLIKQSAVILLLLVILFISNLSTASAQTSATKSDKCTTATLVLVNTKTNKVSSTNKIKSTQASDYAIQVKIKTASGCELGNYSLKAERYDDGTKTNSTPVETLSFADKAKVSSTDLIMNHGVTAQPLPYIYSYTLTVVSGTVTTPLSTVLNVYYTDENGLVGVPPSATNVDSSKTASSNVEIAKITNPFGEKATTVQGVATRVINVLLALIIIAAVLVIVYSGFTMMVGGSDPAKLKKAKAGIFWSLVGLAVAFMSFAIVQIIQGIL